MSPPSPVSNLLFLVQLVCCPVDPPPKNEMLALLFASPHYSHDSFRGPSFGFGEKKPILLPINPTHFYNLFLPKLVSLYRGVERGCHGDWGHRADSVSLSKPWRRCMIPGVSGFLKNCRVLNTSLPSASGHSYQFWGNRKSPT